MLRVSFAMPASLSIAKVNTDDRFTKERQLAEKAAIQAQKQATAHIKEDACIACEREKFLLNMAGSAAQAIGSSQRKSIVRLR